MIFFSFSISYFSYQKLPLQKNPLWDRVIATAAPWVAGEDTLEGEPATLEEAIFLNRLDDVVGACGRIATAFPDKRRQSDLIEPYQQNQEFSRQLDDAFHTS